MDLEHADGAEETPPPGTVTPSDATRDDLNKLLGTALGMAQEQLEAHGAFLPIALAVGDDGGIRMLTVSPPSAGEGAADDGGLDADAMIADLYEVLRQQKDVHRAAAVVCDITLPEEGTDAIHVVTEHQSGVSVAAVQAYTPPAGAGAAGSEPAALGAAAVNPAGWIFRELVWEAEEPQIWV